MFQHFPEEDLLHCTNRDAVESVYMYTVKEADALKHRGGVINNMQRRDHKQLWSGLYNDRFEQFWAVNRKLMEHPGAGPAVGGGGSGAGVARDGPSDVTALGFRHIPYRLHFLDRAYKQSLCRPFLEDGHPVTLGDLLRETVPECVRANRKCSSVLQLNA